MQKYGYVLNVPNRVEKICNFDIYMVRKRHGIGIPRQQRRHGIGIPRQQKEIHLRRVSSFRVL